MARYNSAHFEEMAEVAKQFSTKGYLRQELAYEMAKVFVTSNPLFEARMFFESCGMSEEDTETYADSLHDWWEAKNR